MEPEGSLPHSQARYVMLPLETLPLGDPIWGVVYLRIFFVSRGSILHASVS